MMYILMQVGQPIEGTKTFLWLKTVTLKLSMRQIFSVSMDQVLLRKHGTKTACSSLQATALGLSMGQCISIITLPKIFSKDSKLTKQRELNLRRLVSSSRERNTTWPYQTYKRHHQLGKTIRITNIKVSTELRLDKITKEISVKTLNQIFLPTSKS